jgi:hypothetical protein
MCSRSLDAEFSDETSLGRGWRWLTGALPINRVSGFIDERAVELASSADERALSVVCAIAPGLPSKASNAIVVIKFRVVGLLILPRAPRH